MPRRERCAASPVNRYNINVLYKRPWAFYNVFDQRHYPKRYCRTAGYKSCIFAHAFVVGYGSGNEQTCRHANVAVFIGVRYEFEKGCLLRRARLLDIDHNIIVEFLQALGKAIARAEQQNERYGD